MDPSYNDFLKMVLPEAICDYFELTGYKKDSERERMDLYLQEISTVDRLIYTERSLKLTSFYLFQSKKFFLIQ